MPASDFQKTALPIPTAIGTRYPTLMDSQHIVIDVADEILMREPNASPLTVLTTKASKKREVENQQFYTLERDPQPEEITVASDSGGTVAAASAAQAARTKQYDLLMHVPKTGATVDPEILRVDSVTSANLSVTRAIGGTTQATLAAGDKLFIIGNAYYDGSGVGAVKSVAPASAYDYVQHLRTPFASTGRQLATKFYGGDDWKNETVAQGINHAKLLEKTFLFNPECAIDSSTYSYPQTITRGLRTFIKSMRWDCAGSEPTERQFLVALEEAMRYGKSGRQQKGTGAVKTGICSSRWLTILHALAKDRVQIVNMASAYGLKIARWETIHGALNFVNSPIIDDVAPDAMFICDFAHIKYVNMKGRDTKLFKNVQANDVDLREDEYRSDVALEKTMEEAFAYFYGIPV